MLRVLSPRLSPNLARIPQLRAPALNPILVPALTMATLGRLHVPAVTPQSITASPALAWAGR
jgi:hypothetical protein